MSRLIPPVAVVSLDTPLVLGFSRHKELLLNELTLKVSDRCQAIRLKRRVSPDPLHGQFFRLFLASSRLSKQPITLLLASTEANGHFK